MKSPIDPKTLITIKRKKSTPGSKLQSSWIAWKNWAEKAGITFKKKRFWAKLFGVTVTTRKNVCPKSSAALESPIRSKGWKIPVQTKYPRHLKKKKSDLVQIRSLYRSTGATFWVNHFETIQVGVWIKFETQFNSDCYVHSILINKNTAFV